MTCFFAEKYERALKARQKTKRLIGVIASRLTAFRLRRELSDLRLFSKSLGREASVEIRVGMAGEAATSSDRETVLGTGLMQAPVCPTQYASA